MADARPRVDVLEFSDDLHQDDVEELQRFLTTRIEELTKKLPADSEERAAVDALRDHVSHDCVSLSDDLVEWEGLVARGEQNRSGSTLTLRQDLGERWNLLCRTAAKWTDHTDYSPRWRELRYMCVEHAEFVEMAEEGVSRGQYGSGAAHP